VVNVSSGAAVSAWAIDNRRIESFPDRAISSCAFTVRATGSSMFDCPEHSHTSPTITSSIL
jgi:hypothetical protein